MEYIYFLKLMATIVFALIVGFLSSIPVGGVQLEIIRKSINGHKKPAIATALGSSLSDLIYGILALFGLGNFLLDKDFQLLIYPLGIVVLSYLMYRSLKERSYMLQENMQIRYRKRVSFLTGFSISITNPGMIIWWFVGFKLFVDLNLFTEITNTIKALFVFFGVFGLGLYLILVAVILHRYQKSLSEKFLYRANIFLIVVLSLLILYFIIKWLSLVLNFNLHI